MGMDVFGINPKSEQGEYFRNNVWWWRPLWEYVCSRVEMPDELVEAGHLNMGAEIDEDWATLIAGHLSDDIESGAVDHYQEMFDRHKASYPMTDCDLCDATGIRQDGIGRANGMPDVELDPTIARVVGRTHGWCNACNGYGKQEPVQMWYHFDTENVQRFAEFCAESGGFTIC